MSREPKKAPHHRDRAAMRRLAIDAKRQRVREFCDRMKRSGRDGQEPELPDEDEKQDEAKRVPVS